MKKRWGLLLALLALGGGLAGWWAWRATQGIEVVLDAPLTNRVLFDLSEMNAAALFLEENPQSRIELSRAYYGLEPGQSRPLFEQAISRGVRFIVTSQPSSLLVQSLDLFTDGRALLINTAAVSPLSSGRDDFILRIVPDAIAEQRALARHVSGLPGKRMLVIRDTRNAAYTEPAFATFSATLAAEGRWQVVHQPLDLREFRVEEQSALMAQDFDLLYVLAGDFHESIGNVAQLFHRHHPEAPILITPWARSPAILENMGEAIDRVQLASHFPARRDSAELDAYIRRFRARFGHEPMAMAITVRQAMELLEQAFAAGHRTPEAVKRYLLGTDTHQTSLGPVSFDAYGDVEGRYYFIQDLRRELQ